MQRQPTRRHLLAVTAGLTALGTLVDVRSLNRSSGLV